MSFIHQNPCQAKPYQRLCERHTLNMTYFPWWIANHENLRLNQPWFLRKYPSVNLDSATVASSLIINVLTSLHRIWVNFKLPTYILWKILNNYSNQQFFKCLYNSGTLVEREGSGLSSKKLKALSLSVPDPDQSDLDLLSPNLNPDQSIGIVDPLFLIWIRIKVTWIRH